MQHFLFNVPREQSVRICVDPAVLRLMLDVSPFHSSFPPHLLVHYLHSSCIQEHEPTNSYTSDHFPAWCYTKSVNPKNIVRGV